MKDYSFTVELTKGEEGKRNCRLVLPSSENIKFLELLSHFEMAKGAMDSAREYGLHKLRNGDKDFKEDDLEDVRLSDVGLSVEDNNITENQDER